VKITIQLLCPRPERRMVREASHSDYSVKIKKISLETLLSKLIFLILRVAELFHLYIGHIRSCGGPGLLEISGRGTEGFLEHFGHIACAVETGLFSYLCQ